MIQTEVCKVNLSQKFGRIAEFLRNGLRFTEMQLFRFFKLSLLDRFSCWLFSGKTAHADGFTCSI